MILRVLIFGIENVKLQGLNEIVKKILKKLHI